MRSEKGMTLVELLAVLAIIGIITALIASVLSIGTSSADRTSSKQQLQQEANYIVEAIRAEYLEEKENDLIIITTENSISIKKDDEEEVEKIISEGYKYVLKSKAIIETSKDEKFHLTIETRNELYEIKTTFSKLR